MRKLDGFVDDVMFSYKGASWPEAIIALYFEEVCSVAVPVGRQTNTVFGRVHQNVEPWVKCAIYGRLVLIGVRGE